jgi:hypothetical protein
MSSDTGTTKVLLRAAGIMFRPLLRWVFTVITVIVIAFVLNFARNWLSALIPDIPAMIWIAALILVLGMRIYGELEQIAHPVSEQLKSLDEHA